MQSSWFNRHTSQGHVALRASAVMQSAAVIAIRVFQASATLAVLGLAVTWMGADAYGEFAMMLTTAGLLAVFGQAGLPQVMLRRIGAMQVQAQAGDIRSFFHCCRQIITMHSAALIGGGVLVVSLSSDGMGQALGMGAMAAGLLTLLRACDSWLQARGRPIQGHMGDGILRPVLLLAAMGGALVLVESGTFLASALVLLGCLSAAVTVMVARIHQDLANLPAIPSTPSAPREVLREARPLLAVGILHAAMASSDILILGFWVMPETVGAYHIASRLALLLGLALAAANAVMGPRFARHVAAGDSLAVGRDARRMAFALATPACLAFPIVVLWGEAALTALNPAFAAAHAPLLVLYLGQVVNLGCGPVAVVANLQGRGRQTLRAVAIAALGNIGLTVALVPAFGALGAASATAFGLATWNLLLVRELRRHPTRPKQSGPQQLSAEAA